MWYCRQNYFIIILVELVSCGSESLTVKFNPDDPDLKLWMSNATMQPVAYVYGYKVKIISSIMCSIHLSNVLFCRHEPHAELHWRHRRDNRFTISQYLMVKRAMWNWPISYVICSSYFILSILRSPTIAPQKQRLQ